MKPTVVILLSDKRSGSTLLERELCSQAGIQHVRYTDHSYNETLFWIQAAWLLGIEKSENFRGRYAGTYGDNKSNRKSLENFLAKNISDFTLPETDENLVFEGWELLCSEYAQPIFFEKSPQHPHHSPALELMLKWIRQTKFRVRVIGLVRNPMAVMYSAFQLFQTDPQKRQFGWAQGNRNILRFQKLLSEDQFYFLRYEDLVVEPVEELKRICGFIGYPMAVSTGSTVHADSVEKWKSDPFYTLKLDPEVAGLAYELGYQSSDLENLPGPCPSPNQRVVRQVQLTTRKTKAAIAKLLRKY